MDLTVEIDVSALQKALRIASGELRAELADTIDHISRSFFKNLYQKHFKGPPGLKMGGRGNLFSKFRKRVIGAEGTFSGRASTGVVTASISASSANTEDMGMEVFTESGAAKMHEFGGTITPSKMMPIVFPGKRLTQTLSVIKFGGRLFLARKNRRSKKSEFIAILKNKITLKPRLGFYMTWQDMQNQNIERLNNAISNALARV